MNKIVEILARVQRWIEAHWRMVMVFLCMIIFMQQCTIGRLRGMVEGMVERMAVARDSVACDSVVMAGDTAMADSLLLHRPTQSEVREKLGETGGVRWWVVVLIVVVAGGVVGYVVARRRGVYPFGLSYSGKVKSENGQLLFVIAVRNKSRREIELSGAQVNFVMGASQVRRFRANVSSLPITLQPGTSFEAQINLTGLVSANLELAQARAISMSVEADGKMHTTLPRPVKIEAA